MHEQYVVGVVAPCLGWGKFSFIALRTQTVPTDRGTQLAADFNIPFMETSAKNNINVEAAFIEIARMVKLRLYDNQKASSCVWWPQPPTPLLCRCCTKRVVDACVFVC